MSEVYYSGILKAIREASSSLHTKERSLAEYIITYPEKVILLGITELARESGTSSATISRFCKLFQFRGFQDFKMKLGAEIAQKPSSQSYQDIVAGNSLHRIVEAMESNHLRSISDTTRLLDMKSLQRALDSLRTARRIDLYGVATSGVVAADLHQKLIRIGLQANVYSDPHMQITSASSLSKEDVVFAISYSGETLEIIDALSCAKAQGAATISLTKFGSNTLSGTADINLFTSTLEEGMRRGDMASRIAQLHVIDILFIGLVSHEFPKFVPRLEQSYQMVTKYRKVKGKGLL